MTVSDQAAAWISGRASGTVKQNIEPLPGVLVKQILPA
jgi:hypothetical protein